jgi:hypothetical protein
MKQVLVATETDFWRIGAGTRARTLALVRYLNLHARLTVAYLDGLEPGQERRRASDADDFRRLLPGVDLVWIDPERASGRTAWVREIGALCAERRFDVALLTRLKLSFLLEALPPGTRRVLDTHDLVSHQAESMRRHGYEVPAPLTLDEEVAAFRAFDAVILIQERDFETVAARLGRGRCLLAEHPAEPRKRPARPRVQNVGFVASRWIANIDALSWFVDRVWPELEGSGATLNLYGSICELVEPGDLPRTAPRGVVADLARAYDEIDVVVNPVRFGAGLKIKNVEALAAGLPLVTTTEGARGLEALAGAGLLVADDPAPFADALWRLVRDPSLRASLGEAAHRYASVRFTPDACFGPLRAFIDGR